MGERLVLYRINRYSWQDLLIVPTAITKETTCYYWSGRDRYDKTDIYQTFEDARDVLVERRTMKVESARANLQDAERKLAEAESLTQF